MLWLPPTSPSLTSTQTHTHTYTHTHTHTRRNAGLSPQELMHVRAMLEGIAVCARYPPSPCANDACNRAGAAAAAAAAAPTSPGAAPNGVVGGGLAPTALTAAKDEQAEVGVYACACVNVCEV